MSSIDNEPWAYDWSYKVEAARLLSGALLSLGKRVKELYDSSIPEDAIPEMEKSELSLSFEDGSSLTITWGKNGKVRGDDVEALLSLEVTGSKYDSLPFYSRGTRVHRQVVNELLMRLSYHPLAVLKVAVWLQGLQRYIVEQKERARLRYENNSGMLGTLAVRLLRSTNLSPLQKELVEEIAQEAEKKKLATLIQESWREE